MLNKSRVSADYSKPTSVEYWYSNLFEQGTWIHFRRVGLWSLNETLSTNQLTKLVSNQRRCDTRATLHSIVSTLCL